jgi:hypothetical protein
MLSLWVNMKAQWIRVISKESSLSFRTSLSLMIILGWIWCRLRQHRATPKVSHSCQLKMRSMFKTLHCTYSSKAYRRKRTPRRLKITRSRKTLQSWSWREKSPNLCLHLFLKTKRKRLYYLWSKGTVRSVNRINRWELNIARYVTGAFALMIITVHG